MSENIKDKIKKLLRLANSSNENEAKLAMKKAQELLAKHKLKISDVEGKELKVEKLETGIYFSSRKDRWRGDLIKVISKNYCVEAYMSTAYHSSKHQICLVGMKYDMEICMEVFKFASAHVEDWFRNFKKVEGWKYSSQYLNAAKNTYGIAFSEGVEEVLERQKEQKTQEWGLVMVTPKEAVDFVAGLNPSKSKARANVIHDGEIAYMGYMAGTALELNDKITEKENLERYRAGGEDE